MSPEEVATVLAMVAVAENRPVDQVMVSFWLNTLGVHNVTAAEFRRAVLSHYATVTYPIRPGHVWQIVQREREWAHAQGIVESTTDRVQRLTGAAIAMASGDWGLYDQAYPGERRERAERDLAWWIEHPQHVPTQRVEDALAEFGLTLPDRCLSISCLEYAVDSGEGRFCATCQGHNGSCANDHCLNCGEPT